MVITQEWSGAHPNREVNTTLFPQNHEKYRKSTASPPPSSSSSAAAAAAAGTEKAATMHAMAMHTVNEFW